MGRVTWTITEDEAVEDYQGNLYYRAVDQKGRPGRIYYYGDGVLDPFGSFVVEEFEYTRWERLQQRLGIYGVPLSKMAFAVLSGFITVVIIGVALGATLLPDPWGKIFVYGSIAVGVIWLISVAVILFWVGFDKLARMLGYTRKA